MERAARPPSAGIRLWRGLLLVAGLDRLLLSLWAIVRPGDLFDFVRLPPTQDAFLWPLLGLLGLGSVACLALAVWRPRECGGLVLVPLFGQCLAVGLWAWLLGTDRLVLPSHPLLILFAHDAFWLPVFAGFLWVWRRGRDNTASTMDGEDAPAIPKQGNGP